MTPAFSRPGFQFGLQAAGPLSAKDWKELLRRAEALGYDAVNFVDYVGWMPAPVPFLAAAATVTERLRLGVMVFCADFYHPVLLARDAATIDQLSDGRLDLGLGIGGDGRAAEYAMLGRVPERPPARMARLAVTVAVLRACFTGTPGELTWQNVSLSGLDMVPRPVQQGGPPIVIGGASPKMLQLAGRHADVVGLSLPTPGGRIDGSRLRASALAECVGWARAGAAAAGRAVSLTLLSGGGGPAIVTPDTRAALRERLDFLRHRPDFPIDLPDDFTEQDLADSPYVLIGSTDAIVEKLEKLQAVHGITSITVEASSAEAFAPVVERLAH